MKITQVTAIVISPIHIHFVLNDCCSMLCVKRKWIQVKAGLPGKREMKKYIRKEVSMEHEMEVPHSGL